MNGTTAFQNVIRGLIFIIVFCTGCASVVPRYTHDLPEIYRTAIFDFNKAATVNASLLALEKEGYAVALSDSTAGVIITKPRVMPALDPEIGGEWELVCLLNARAIQGKTLVTAEILAQGQFTSERFPMAVNRSQARALYRDLFRKIQAELEK